MKINEKRQIFVAICHAFVLFYVIPWYVFGHVFCIMSVIGVLMKVA